MKILIISQYFWPETFRINDLAIELDERGYDVEVLTGYPNYPGGKFYEGYNPLLPSREILHNVKIQRVPLLPRFSAKAYQLALNYLSFVISSYLFGPFLCRSKYDVIFVFEPSPFTVGLPGVMFRWIKSAPMIFWVQDLWPESLQAAGQIKSNLIINLTARMVRFIYKRCDKILIQSKGFYESVIKYDGNEKFIEVFPNWAEKVYQPVELPSDDPKRKEISASKTILFAGNLGEAQSLETIIFAADLLRNQISDLKWIIIGSGRKESWLKEKVNEADLNDRFLFLGRKPMEQMPGYFSLADLLLVTLKKKPIFAQTIPSKIQSYLACAKPIVAALDGVGADIINESGSGIAVDSEDGTALAGAIYNMLEMPDNERKQLGIRGFEYYKKHFDRKILIDRLEDIMNQTLVYHK